LVARRPLTGESRPLEPAREPLRQLDEKPIDAVLDICVIGEDETVVWSG
jgi:hypothetical protein